MSRCVCTAYQLTNQGQMIVSSSYFSQWTKQRDPDCCALVLQDCERHGCMRKIAGAVDVRESIGSGALQQIHRGDDGADTSLFKLSSTNTLQFY